MMHITLGVTDVKTVRARALRVVPETGTLLRPREVVTLEPDGFPVIITVSMTEMVVAHCKEPSTVDGIVEKLSKRCAVDLNEISMSIQMYTPHREETFLERARQIGLRHVWASRPIAEILTQMRAPIGVRNFVTICRDS